MSRKISTYDYHQRQQLSTFRNAAVKFLMGEAAKNLFVVPSFAGIIPTGGVNPWIRPMPEPHLSVVSGRPVRLCQRLRPIRAFP